MRAMARAKPEGELSMNANQMVKITTRLLGTAFGLALALFLFASVAQGHAYTSHTAKAAAATTQVAVAHTAKNLDAQKWSPYGGYGGYYGGNRMFYGNGYGYWLRLRLRLQPLLQLVLLRMLWLQLPDPVLELWRIRVYGLWWLWLVASAPSVAFPGTHRPEDRAVTRLTICEVRRLLGIGMLSDGHEFSM